MRAADCIVTPAATCCLRTSSNLAANSLHRTCHHQGEEHPQISSFLTKFLVAGESTSLEVLGSVCLASDLVSGVPSHVGCMYQDTPACNENVAPYDFHSPGTMLFCPIPFLGYECRTCRLQYVLIQCNQSNLKTTKSRSQDFINRLSDLGVYVLITDILAGSIAKSNMQ